MSFAGRRRGNKVKKGVQFTLMVVGWSFPRSPRLCLLLTRRFSPRATGASGTGRTTFVNTLCESEVLAHKISDNPATAHIEEGIRIKPVNVGQLHRPPGVYITFKHIMTELEEDGVRIALTIVDTPGFGDNIDNEFAFVSSRTSYSH